MLNKVMNWLGYVPKASIEYKGPTFTAYNRGYAPVKSADPNTSKQRAVIAWETEAKKRASKSGLRSQIIMLQNRIKLYGEDPEMLKHLSILEKVAKDT